jgi:inner membrane protein
MYLPGHLGLGLLAGAVLAVRYRGGRGVVVASVPVVLATAPDIDIYLAGIPHRGVTHTAWAALGLGTVLAVVAGLWTWRRGTKRTAIVTPAFVAGVVAGLTHLLGDVVTPMGISPFHPVVSTTYSLDLVAARNPDANLALLCGGCLAVGGLLVCRRGRVAPGIRAHLDPRQAIDGDRSA